MLLSEGFNRWMSRLRSAENYCPVCYNTNSVYEITTNALRCLSCLCIRRAGQRCNLIEGYGDDYFATPLTIEEARAQFGIVEGIT